MGIWFINQRIETVARQGSLIVNLNHHVEKQRKWKQQLNGINRMEFKSIFVWLQNLWSFYHMVRVKQWNTLSANAISKNLSIILPLAGSRQICWLASRNICFMPLWITSRKPWRVKSTFYQFHMNNEQFGLTCGKLLFVY